MMQTLPRTLLTTHSATPIILFSRRHHARLWVFSRDQVVTARFFISHNHNLALCTSLLIHFAFILTARFCVYLFTPLLNNFFFPLVALSRPCANKITNHHRVRRCSGDLLMGKERKELNIFAHRICFFTPSGCESNGPRASDPPPLFFYQLDVFCSASTKSTVMLLISNSVCFPTDVQTAVWGSVWCGREWQSPCFSGV